MPQIHTLNEQVSSQDDNQAIAVLDTVETEPESSPINDDWTYATKELLDTLPRVWTRGLLYFLVVFVGIALPWAMLFKVDETGTARGRLEPKGKTVRLDAPVAGTVSVIKVKEGELVKAGQLLGELETDLINNELQQQQTKLEGQQNRLHQLQLLYNQLLLVLRTQQQQNQAQELEKLAQVYQARQNFESLKASYYLQKEEELAQVYQVKQTLKHNQTALKLEEVRLANSQREVERYQNAFKEGIVSETQTIEREDSAKERQKIYEQIQSDIEQTKLQITEKKSSYERTLQQAQAEIKQAQLRLKEQEKSYQSLTRSGQLAILKNKEQIKNLETEIITLKADIVQTKSQVLSLKFQLNQRILKAPIAGTIFQLPIQRAGAVVQSGSMIAEIAPQGSSLILRAQMATTESGSLRKGLPVKIKFDAYPFQDYGVVEGKLTNISPTTKETETGQGQIDTYALQIELNQTCIPSPKECLTFRPGDTATAEVIIRQRRIIDFIIDPFKKLQQGGLKL